jgi:hypothetical protein
LVALQAEQSLSDRRVFAAVAFNEVMPCAKSAALKRWQLGCGTKSLLASARSRAARALAQQLDDEMLPSHSKVLLWLVTKLRDMRALEQERRKRGVVCSAIDAATRVPSSKEAGFGIHDVWTRIMDEMCMSSPQREKIHALFCTLSSKSLDVDLRRLAMAISIVR